MTPNMGIVGANSSEYIKEITDIVENNETNKIFLQPEKYMDLYWGVSLFFYKSSYTKIPDEMKIFCGDEWIFEHNKRLGRQNYFICGQTIYHVGKLSSGQKSLSEIGKRDHKIYDQYMHKWYEKIFLIEGRLNGLRITIFGIRIAISYKKRAKRV